MFSILQMRQQRYIIIGDVHGCYKELIKLLKKCDYDPLKHKLIFVGDLLNKGPQSRECYEFALSNPSTIVLKGNHERRFAEAVRERRLDQFPSFKKMTQKWKKGLVKSVAAWCDSLPLIYQTRDFMVIHAGFNPLNGLKNTSERDLTELRWVAHHGSLVPWHEFYKGSRTLFYGHWARQGFCKNRKTICLDSGCVYGGKLSAFLWPEKRLVQVKAARPYQKVSSSKF